MVVVSWNQLFSNSGHHDNHFVYFLYCTVTALNEHLQELYLVKNHLALKDGQHAPMQHPRSTAVWFWHKLWLSCGQLCTQQWLINIRDQQHQTVLLANAKGFIYVGVCVVSPHCTCQTALTKTLRELNILTICLVAMACTCWKWDCWPISLWQNLVSLAQELLVKVTIYKWERKQIIIFVEGTGNYVWHDAWSQEPLHWPKCWPKVTASFTSTCRRMTSEWQD